MPYGEVRGWLVEGWPVVLSCGVRGLFVSVSVSMEGGDRMGWGGGGWKFFLVE